MPKTPASQSTPKQAVGLGLTALLDGDAAAALAHEVALDQPSTGRADTRNGTLRSVSIAQLRRNPKQPRKSFDDDRLQELADSIAHSGILQPILVRPDPSYPGDYQIVAGERRWRAAQRAALHDVPVIVQDLSDAQAAEAAVIENVQRHDLNPIEEAAGYQALIKEYGYTQERLSQVVGKSRPNITNSMRLLGLPEPVQALLQDGRLTAGHGRVLLAHADPVGMAETVVRQGLSVRDLERRVAAAAKSKKPVPAADPDTLELAAALGGALGLGASVKIEDKGGDKGGRLIIRYDSLETLDAICARLAPGLR